MKTILTLLLTLFLLNTSFSQEKFEDDLDAFKLRKFRVELNRAFNQHEGFRILMVNWLDVTTLNEYENLMSKFLEPKMKGIRQMVFDGMANKLCPFRERCEMELQSVGISNEEYWSNYLVNIYKPSSIQAFYKIDEDNPNTLDKVEVIKLVSTEKWMIYNSEKTSKGYFQMDFYEDYSCNIEMEIDKVLYKSIKCINSENLSATLKNQMGDVLEIEFFIPELAGVDIDILGTNVRFDYSSFKN
ncbi:hypothetical protein ACFQO1_02100 [Jejudonia soesokkakensis]|uniref:Uncharacterized protein n=1 Tax=Jejudonia soesokkakensis TaxID=1323432 RepID=A0ABW2MUM4_9FLAO